MFAASRTPRGEAVGGLVRPGQDGHAGPGRSTGTRVEVGGDLVNRRARFPASPASSARAVGGRGRGISAEERGGCSASARPSGTVKAGVRMRNEAREAEDVGGFIGAEGRPRRSSFEGGRGRPRTGDGSTVAVASPRAGGFRGGPPAPGTFETTRTRARGVIARHASRRARPCFEPDPEIRKSRRGFIPKESRCSAPPS